VLAGLRVVGLETWIGLVVDKNLIFNVGLTAMNSFTPAIRSSLLQNSSRGDTLRRWSIKELLSIKDTNAANAEFVLHEIRTRLAIQHQRLASFSRVEEYAKISSSTDGATLSKSLKMLLQLHENTYILPHEIIETDFFEGFSSRPKQIYVRQMVDDIMTRHGASVDTFADAAIASRNIENQIPNILRRQFRADADILQNPEPFLHSRLLIQLLCEHYVSLNKCKPTGAVSIGADILDIVDDATTEAKHVADANLGIAPEVRLRCEDEHNFVPPPIIRSWLHHAIMEVTKNAIMSTVEKWDQQPSHYKEPLPSNIMIDVSRDADFMYLRVVDNGLGLNADRSEKAFRFAASSSQKRWDRLDEQQSYAAVRQPLGSLGVGLSLSNLMMKCFGGSISLNNNHRQPGCTATLKLNYNDDYKALN
jgi:pyruvate dehydrogenase kinase 2/3/4